MKEEFIELTDGTKLGVKINFGTMYYLTQIGGNALARRIEKKKKKKQRASESEQMEFTAKVIYAILRSNGKEVTFDEALMLMPTNVDAMKKVIKAYEKEVEKYKKKQESKTMMKEFSGK